MATLWHQYGISMASPWERREKGVAMAWKGFGKGLARDYSELTPQLTTI